MFYNLYDGPVIPCALFLCRILVEGFFLSELEVFMKYCGDKLGLIRFKAIQASEVVKYFHIMDCAKQ